VALFRKSEVEELDMEFMSDSSAAMLQGAPIRFHLVLWVAVTFLFFALIWASYATLDVVTTGEGKVIPSSNKQTVQNLEGGIIKDIRVKPGDVVEKGQIIMLIDDTRFASSLQETEEQIHALEAKLARLTSEATGRPLTFSEDLKKNYSQYVANETNLYESKQRELAVKLNILRDQEEQRLQELAEVKNKLQQFTRSLALVTKEMELTRPLVNDGAVSEVELLRLERNVNDLTGELEQTELSIPRVEANLAGARKKIDELTISAKTEALSELNAAKGDYQRFVEQIRAAEDRVYRTDVRSPVTGTVNEVHVTTIGGIIQPGQDLVEIIPLNDTLLIEANIRPSDIGFLRPNLDATVKISAYDFSIHGGLEAMVEHISADTITDERGDSFYKIRVRTTDKSYLVGKQGEKLHIIPGMSATVDILTGEKTVLEYLLKPIIKAKQNAMRER
jgi:adhesin transport system membrane fusion protein